MLYGLPCQLDSLLVLQVSEVVEGYCGSLYESVALRTAV